MFVVLQVSSLLRGIESPDKVKYCIRNVQQQSHNTRLCGYYAVAAALAACKGEDVTGCIYDEVVLYTEVQERLSRGTVEPITDIAAAKDCVKNVIVQTRSKVHCSCQRAAKGKMIQCSGCMTWYHEDCVERIPSPAINDEEFPWYSEVCCRNVPDEQTQTCTLATGDLQLLDFN